MRSDSARLGTVELGCFRLKELLGRGSYGTAFLADQEGFDREAVVKIAHPELLEGRDRDLVRARYRSELRAATRVNHPNVVTLFTAGDSSDGLPAIAMEYVAGETLEELLERRAGRLAPSFLRAIFEQLASGVCAFHNAEVTHRDLSPKNIMVGQDGAGGVLVKVLDFGAAKVGGPGGPVSVVGTPRYMAPEQVIGVAGAPCDIYAVGAILWWALTGHEYQSDILTLADVTQARIMGAPDTDPRSVAPELPPRAAELLGRMVAFEEVQRPSAAEFVDAWPACVAELHDLDDRVATRSWERETAPSKAARPGTERAVPQPVTTRESGLDCVVIEPNAIRRSLLQGFIRRSKCRVLGGELPAAGIGGLDRAPDVIFVSSEMVGGAAGPTVHRARRDFPGATVIAVGPTPNEAAPLVEAGAHHSISVPGGFGLLQEVLNDLLRQRPTGSSTARRRRSVVDVSMQDHLLREDPEVAREAIELFMGTAPDLLARISDAIAERDVGSARSACRSLSTNAQALGGGQLARLSTACAALLEDGDFPTAQGFMTEIEAEYGLVFREMMSLHTQTTAVNR